MVETTIKNSSANEQIKKKHIKYIAEFATFHYTDDAIKEYFKSQQSRPEHQNTIYVILGDHMMGEIAQSSAIEKYRSALMIYSPLLKRTKTFKGTNSHLDIPPSLDRKCTRLNSSHVRISYAVFCLKKKNTT